VRTLQTRGRKSNFLAEIGCKEGDNMISQIPVVTILKDRLGEKLFKGETIALIIGAIIIILGILACMWNSSCQDLIIRSISLTFS
jgi:ABC-type dipeptide/oligopeptide/nickel transport system permease component